MLVVQSFFDSQTFTASHVAHCSETGQCAIIDPVLTLDPLSWHTDPSPAQHIVDYIRAQQLTVRWILETHVHADHLTAAPWLKAQLGGQIAIGSQITAVQALFGAVFNAGAQFATDGRQFDRLFDDGDQVALGALNIQVLHTPGHTPACVSYLIDDAVFVGDTLFMPDYGTARCDFPGGDAATLYRSIQRLLTLPDATRMYLCHDYLSPQRQQYCWQTSVAAQRDNIHLQACRDEAAFVAFRHQRDATLSLPRLIVPSVQVNMRAGELPPAEENGTHYLKFPLNRL